MNQGIVTLLCAISLNALANILIKVGMMRVGKTSGILMLAKRSVLQPAILAGMLCFVLGLAAYSAVLTKLNLSVAYPIMVSAGLIIVALASALLLHESISAVQVIGFLAIIAGVWMVAK
jgi:small multidrug resistance pump